MAIVTIIGAFNGDLLGTYENINWMGFELARHVQNDHLIPPSCIKALVHDGATVDENRPIIDYCDDLAVGTFHAVVEKVDLSS